MKKILVPCDFSTQAIQAYKFAMDVAVAAQGEVLVLKVVDLPFLYESAFGVQPSWHDPSIEKEFEQQFRKQYEKMKQMHAEIPAPVSFSTARGSVAITILKVIEEQNIDLVVMGTQGGGESELSSIGTNTARIIRSSPVPVISLRNAIDISAIKNIVFPTGLELDQKRLVSRVQSLQALFNATLHVLLINTPNHFQEDRVSRNSLNEFARHYKLNTHSLNVRNDIHEVDGIIDYSSEVKADIIAIGTHGRKGLSHALYGSIAESVVNSARCPVWTSTLVK